MRLLIFAHRGEAKAFLNANVYNMDKSAPVVDLYKTDSEYLLITGEGIELAMIKTAIALTYLHSKNCLPSLILNIGLCGVIDPQETELIGKVLEIRTVYAYRERNEFKSFTTPAESLHDLVTTERRVLNAEQSKKILPIAKLVDREAWGIFYAIQQSFKIPFKCLKMVSDNVHHDTEFCQRIKESAEKYSISLYQYFSEHFLEDQSLRIGEDKISNLPIELNSFYFTFAQKNLFYSLCGKLNLEPKNILKEYDLKDLLESKKTPKEKTKVLLLRMQKSLSPMLFDLRDRLTLKSQKFSDDKINFNFDPNLEKEEIRASIQFKNERDREYIIEKIKSFPLEDFQKIYRGDL